MKKIILVLILFIFNSTYSQSSLEQIAFDYFIDDVVNIDYPNVKKIKFSGTTESITSGLMFSIECLDKDENQFVLENGFKTKEDLIKIKNNSVSKIIRKSQEKKIEKLLLIIYQSLKLNNKYFVEIRVMQKNQGTFYHFILNDKNEIISWCKTPFII